MEQLLALQWASTLEFRIMTLPQEPRQLKDYDVLGVGACRREHLLKGAEPRILWTHPALFPLTHRSIYEAILQQTIQWLKPQDIREDRQTSEKELLSLLLEDFQREFPRTAGFLKPGLKEILKAYLLDFPWQGPLLSDHFRYFPGFLKEKAQDPRLCLLAQKEWLRSYLSFTDFGFPRAEAGRIFVNPSLQTLYSESKGEGGIKPGLYLFYYDFSRREVLECPATLAEAAAIDLLGEERPYTMDQLVEQLLLTELKVRLAPEEWRKKLSYLLKAGILLEAGARRISD